MNSFWEFLFFSMTLAVLFGASWGSQTCSEDYMALPRGQIRKCKIYPNRELPVRWGKGCLADYSPVAECQAFVAMIVEMECVLDSTLKGHNVEVYRDDQMRSGSETLRITSVQYSDGGEYECRTTFSNNGSSSSTFFNLSISSGLFIN